MNASRAKKQKNYTETQYAYAFLNITAKYMYAVHAGWQSQRPTTCKCVYVWPLAHVTLTIPMTSIYELDLDMRKMYLHTKMKF